MARRQAELEEYTTSKLRRSKGESCRGITTRLGKGVLVRGCRGRNPSKLQLGAWLCGASCL